MRYTVLRGPTTRRRFFEYPCLSTLFEYLLSTRVGVPVFEYPLSTLTCPCTPVRLRCRAAPPTSAVGIIRVYIYMCIYTYYISVRIYMRAMYCAHCPRVPRSTRAVSARARAGARAARAGAAAALQRRTGGGECGAQQLRVRVAGADRVRVEERIVGAGVVAAPREGRLGLHEREPRRSTRGLARGGSGGAARRLGLDPHGARRARVAAPVTGHVRACARRHRRHRPSAVPQRPRTSPGRSVCRGTRQ